MKVVAMGFRGYRAHQNDPATDELRARLFGAARALLDEQKATFASFSLDLVAARAGVARSILQQQFRSQAGLLEALFDRLLVTSRARQRPSDEPARPRAALDGYIVEVARLWDEERLVIRRLRALAAFDRELASALATRDDHRREGILRIVLRASAHPPKLGRSPKEFTDCLFALTSFEALDTLAGPSRSIASVLPSVQELARAALRPNPERPSTT